MSNTTFDLTNASPTTIARTEVKRGERLVWADRAVRRRPGLGSWRVIIVGLAFAGFGLLWILMAWAATAAADDLWRFFPLFGVPFVMIGVAIATAPFWLGSIGSSTVYGLTDQRVFMMYGKRMRIVRSTELGKMGDLLMNEQLSGVGDITFADVLQSTSGERGYRVLGLFGIPDVKRVRDLIEREKARAAANAAPPAGTAA